MGRIVAFSKWDELTLGTNWSPFGIWDELSLGTNCRLGLIVAQPRVSIEKRDFSIGRTGDKIGGLVVDITWPMR